MDRESQLKISHESLVVFGAQTQPGNALLAALDLAYLFQRRMPLCMAEVLKFGVRQMRVRSLFYPCHEPN
jgi:hypothetical protein